VPAAGGITFAGIGDEAAPDLRGQLAAVSALGWHAVELRTVDGVALADLGDREFDAAACVLASHGTTVAAVASRIGNWARPADSDFGLDASELDVLARRGAALGARFVRVMSYPNAGLIDRDWRRVAVGRLRALAGRAAERGLVLVHENCAGWAGSSADRMLDLLDAVDSPALRLLFDTGNGIAHGYDPYPVLERIAAHVVHVHVKDARRSGADTVYTTPGTGQARVADCLRLLVAAGFAGTWSIEPHLALRPHEARPGTGDHDGFVASGRALVALARDKIAPHFPGLTVHEAGISRGGSR
jgi:sugar phosphate isomerase/epimerase